ncbi:hypothetical protein [Aureimonas sp. ME7]|uniref:hypothetical protein n=1 Tax=Aureimonas sp. ME7 TaxID=2744252 RepID=UPI0015F37514|nr:hypothetical protein [Aureimonas sp. ME7]
MKRILIAAAALGFAAAPALAQSTDGGSTAGGATVMPETNATGTMQSGDNMGSAATTGDTAAAPATGAMGTDNMSTSSTTPEAPMGAGTPTQGMDSNAGAAASGTTPSGGIVPGQTPE